MKKLILTLILFVSVLVPRAYALDPFNPGNLSAFDATMVEQVIKTLGIGGDYRPMAPASPLGLKLGFDIGVGASVVRTPGDFTSTFALATGQSSGNIPQYIPVVAFGIQKGLPKNIDFNFAYSNYQSIYNVWALGLKYSFIDGAGAKPALAGRVTYNSSKLWFVQTKTYKFDFLVSKNLYLIEPYAGAGFQYWSGTLEVPATSNLTVSADASGINPHVFIGVPLKLVALRFVGEMDYSFAGIITYGAKFSLNF